MAKKKNKNIKKAKSKSTSSNNSLGLAFFVIPLIIAIFINAIIYSLMDKNAYFYISPVFKNYKTVEKTKYKKLDNYFIDEVNLFEDDRYYSRVNHGSDYLYEKTGVRVFFYGKFLESDSNQNLIIPTEEEGEKVCQELCNSMSENGVNLVIMYAETNEGFETYTYATEEVRDVFGTKLEKILQQYLVYNFHVVGTYYQLVADSYISTADRIMGGFTSPLDVINENLRVVVISCVTIIIFTVSIIFYRRFDKKVGNHKTRMEKK